jgi:hypothetical protein
MNRWEVVQCRLWVMAHNRFLVLLMLAFSLGVPLQTVFSSELSAHSLGFRIFYVIFFTAIMLCFMLVVQVVVQVLWVIFKKNRGVVGAHELEIRDDGLVERTEVNESLHRWEGFHKIGSTRKCLYIFVTDNIVYYLPLKSFASAQDAKQFTDEIRRRSHLEGTNTR